MDNFDYWRLCDVLTVHQAAYLISSEPGTDPRMPAGQEPPGYQAVKAALVNSVNAGRLAATVRYEAREYGWAERMNDLEASHANHTTIRGIGLDDEECLSKDSEFVYHATPDWNQTTVEVQTLVSWLESKGWDRGFFSRRIDQAEYLDPDHSRYSQKLAAAIRAWEAVGEPQGQHPKGALLKWLREHAVQYDLTNPDGTLNEQGIEDCAKVANWRLTGGAPKTPG